ncbi:hypothetical protein [Pedococcus sp. 2YAF34]|uniref:hypothetical protein n=1 Tax=Pedococcus sp. 2YAF34 TaxID=3233032 RepID=UPI003F9DCD3C
MRRNLAGLGAVRVLLLALAAVLLVGAVTVSVPVLSSAGLLVACVALVAALGVLVQGLWQSRGHTDWSHTFAAPAQPRGVDTRITRLAGDVRAAAAGDADAGRRLHAAVSMLAVDHLRLRRGLSLADEPEAAGAALGPDLTAYLTQPPPSRLPGDRLAAFTTTLEEL